jgi:uncharacterized protein (TIGR02145 family)
MKTIKIELQISSDDSLDKILCQLGEKITSRYDAYNKDYAIINGIKLKRTNEKLGECEHFTQREAIELASIRGLGLPSKEEWVRMLNLDHTWDEEKQGIWVGANHSLKRETDRSTFLPASGYIRHDDISPHLAGKEGDYWSCTPNETVNGYHIFFNAIGVKSIDVSSRHYEFPVRCIQK